MPTEVFFATNRTQPRRKGGPFGNRFHTDGPHFYEVGRAQVTWRDADQATRDWDEYTVAYQLETARRPPVDPLAQGVAPEMHRKALADVAQAPPAERCGCNARPEHERGTLVFRRVCAGNRQRPPYQ